MKYEKTKIGSIPDDWEIAKIGQIGEVVTGSTPSTKKAEYYGGTVPFITPSDLDGTKLVNKTERYLTDKGVQVSRPIPQNSVCITCIASIGKACIAPQKSVTNQQINSILPNDKFDSHYLYYFITNNQERLKSLAGSTTVPIVNKSSFEQFEIICPPIREQNKIAEILFIVDADIEKTDAIVKETQQLKKGMMLDLFKLDDFPLKPLSRLTEEDRPITYGVVKPGDLDEKGVLFIRSGDIQSGKIMLKNLRTISKSISNVYKRTILKGGEILISLVGYPGEVAIVPNELIGANIARQAGMIALQDKETVPFIMYYLMSPTGKSKLLYEQIGSAQQVINLANLKKIKIPIVPKSIQNKIVSTLKELDAKVDNEKNYKSELEQLKKGLSQVLLTGKVRVKV